LPRSQHCMQGEPERPCTHGARPSVPRTDHAEPGARKVLGRGSGVLSACRRKLAAREAALHPPRCRARAR
jgi:hypothetical protein